MSVVLHVLAGAVLWVGVGVLTFRALDHFSMGDPGWLHPGSGQVGREGHAKMGFWLGPIYATVIVLILLGALAWSLGASVSDGRLYRRVMGLDQ